MHIFHNKEELFLNEYNWDSFKENNDYSFKIRLNTNNTILFSCTMNAKNEKLYFDNCFSLKDLHYYDRFKNNENVNDIYIYLLSMIQENQFEFEQKEENKLILSIKPYTNSEILIEFILDKKDIVNKKCEICDRMHSGINYLRFMRDNHNHNIISSNNNISYNINCNYNSISNNDIDKDKNIISKILEEISILKKENSLKNEEIKNLKNELKEQNIRLFKENQLLKQEINNIKKADEIKDRINIMTGPKTRNENNINLGNSEPTIKSNKGKKIFLKVLKVSNEFFNKDPNELKYNSTIVKNLSAKGVNDIFEVFICNKDNQEYLVSKNAKTHNLDIILLNNNKIINSLKGHNSTISMVRYFINLKGKNEYLISADFNKNVIVWDINNNYNILNWIRTESDNSNILNYNIYSCYIFFDNFDNNFIFTSSGINTYKKNDTAFTKMYSLKDGNFVKNIINSNDNNTYYLLVWYNEKSKINYLIECCEGKIAITNFKQNELYATLVAKGYKVLKYYSGFIYNSDNKIGKDYLCCSSSNGCIVIWELMSKQFTFISKISKVELYNIIQWDKKYAIVSGGSNKSIIIFDLENLKEEKNIQTEHSSKVNCIKKIIHPIYGESLLSSGNDYKIRLWTI